MEMEDSMELVIKWNKETLSLKAEPGHRLDHLRAAIYSLAAVQPEKQKLIFKGKILKEDSATLKDLGITNVG